MRGDAHDVARAIDGADVVASFLGNPYPNPRSIFIMEAAADHIMTAAAAQPESDSSSTAWRTPDGTDPRG